MMKVTMLLLVSSVALLAAGAVGSPLHDRIQLNLNSILDLAQNDSLPPDVLKSFVEDVEYLAEGSNKCEQKFFCKVEGILEEHEHFATEEVLVETLKQYNRDAYNVSCEKYKTKQEGTINKFEVRKLLHFLRECIRHTNFTRKSPSDS